MRKVIAVLVLALVVVLVILDRLAPGFAGDAVAKQFATERLVGSNPDVSFHGFPFLTQVVSGKYKDLEVTANKVHIGRFNNVKVVAHLRGVHAPVKKVISRDIDRLPVDDATGTATVSYAELMKASGVSGLTIAKNDDHSVRLTATIQLNNQDLHAVAIAEPRIIGNELVINANQVTVNGLPVPAELLAAANQRLSFSQQVELPFGLIPQSVHIGSHDLSLTAAAKNVVLRRGGIPQPVS